LEKIQDATTLVVMRMAPGLLPARSFPPKKDASAEVAGATSHISAPYPNNRIQSGLINC